MSNKTRDRIAELLAQQAEPVDPAREDVWRQMEGTDLYRGAEIKPPLESTDANRVPADDYLRGMLYDYPEGWQKRL